MSVTIRQLKIFNAVVESGQVTRAAQGLSITQSAVSLALNEMENQLGGALFDRSGRSLELNDRGRYFLPISREILDKLDNLDMLMNEKDGQFGGSLNLVASSTIGNYVLPYLLTAFKSMNPHVYFSMRVCDTQTAESLIVDREADLGFVEGEVHNEHVTVTPWIQDELVLVSGSGNSKDSERVCKVATDISKYKWVMREAESRTAQIFKSKLGNYVTDLNVVMELGHTEAIKKAVEAGAGIACLSSLTVCRAVERGSLQKIRLEGVDMTRQLYVIQHKNKAKTRFMNEFLDFCFLLSHCREGRFCLSSPENFQDLVCKFTRKKKRGEEK